MNESPDVTLPTDPKGPKVFVSKLRAQIRSRQRMQQEFAESEVFRRMLSAIRECAQPRSVSGEAVAYFADEVRAQLSWEFASETDMNRFIDLVADPNGPGVDPTSLREDENCSFENVEFTSYGLHVSMMFGQGTSIVISNKAAATRKD